MTPAELGDRISRAGILAAPDKRLAEMGRVAMEYAEKMLAHQLEKLNEAHKKATET